MHENTDVVFLLDSVFSSHRNYIDIDCLMLKIVLFYRFTIIEKPEVLEEFIRSHCLTLDLLGRVLIAPEGLNGTLSGLVYKIEEFVKYLSEYDSCFAKIDWKYSSYDKEHPPFPDLYIKNCNELIGIGQIREKLQPFIKFSHTSFGGLDENCTGLHLQPNDFHESILNSTDPLILDVRNDMEYQIGHFQKSTSIGTICYSETWKRIDDLLCQYKLNDEKSTKQIFMYCTGGIRCEKASAYLIQRGLPRERIFQVIQIFIRFF